MNNEIVIIMDSKSCNEAFARVASSAFVSRLDPLLSDVTEIKTAVSEAVTNAIIHGYNGESGKITLRMLLDDGDGYSMFTAEVSDSGVGIGDIEAARQPLFTTKPEMERSGMGFTVIETFMDEVEVLSEPGAGTRVIMRKKLCGHGGTG